MPAQAVSREPESQALTAFLATARSTPAGLVIEGEAGIGKTTFALHACEKAEAEGFRVLVTRGSPGEVTLSFAGLADLLAEVSDDVLDRLAPVQREALHRILLRGSEMPGADERAAAAAFQAVLRHLADESPVLVVVDDIQWLDTASAAALRFAVRRTVAALGVLVTVRTGEPESEVTPSLELAHPDAVRRVRMTPLTLGGVHALIASRLGQVLARPAMRRIHEVSGGNPLYALELARAVTRRAPHRSPTPRLVGRPGQRAGEEHHPRGRRRASRGRLHACTHRGRRRRGYRTLAAAGDRTARNR